MRTSHRPSRTARAVAGLVAVVLATVLATAPLAASAQAARSDYYFSGGVGTHRFAMKISGSMNSTWRGYLSSGISEWNGTYSSTGTLISQTTGSSNKTMRLGSLPAGMIGRYEYSGGRSDRTFRITVDAQQIIDHPDRVSSIGAWAKFTSMHELGHALSLRDNPATTSSSIMKYKPMGWTGVYGSPRSYDRNAVAAIY